MRRPRRLNTMGRLRTALGLTGGNGSGREVSSLTADYHRSRECGTEEAPGSPGAGAEHPPRRPSSASPFGELHLLRLEYERRHPVPLDDDVAEDRVSQVVPPLDEHVRR